MLQGRAAVREREDFVRTSYEAVAAPSTTPAARPARQYLWRWAPLALVATVVGWDLWELRVAVAPVAYLNDGSVHQQMVRDATRLIGAGRLPFTSWLPYIGLGSAQFLHYQSLGSVLTGLAGTVVGANTAYRWSLVPPALAVAPGHLLLCEAVRPDQRSRGRGSSSVAIRRQLHRGRVRARRLHVGRWGRGLDTAARVVGLAVRVGDHVAGHEGCPVYMGRGGPRGLDRRAPFLVRLPGFPRRDRTGAGGRRSAVEAPGAGGRAVCRFFGGCGVGNRAAHLVEQMVRHQPTAGRDAIREGLRRAPGARLAVHRADVRCQAGVACYHRARVRRSFLAVARWRRDALTRSLLALFVACLLLSFGSSTWGGLANLVPAHADLYFRRFTMGSQLAGIYLAGTAVAFAWQVWVRIVDVLASSRLMRVTALVVRRRRHSGVVLPRRRETSNYDQRNTSIVQAQQTADKTDGAMISPLISYIKQHGDGRTYAGLPNNWGHSFTVGFVPVYKYIESQDVDEVTYVVPTLSLMLDPETNFDEDNPSDYTIFGVRYLLLPVGMTPPVPAQPVMEHGIYSLWQISSNGYVDLVQLTGTLSADRADIGNALMGSPVHPGAARGLVGQMARGGRCGRPRSDRNWFGCRSAAAWICG